MTANVYGPLDKVSKSGDTMSGPLTLQGSPPLIVPGAGAGAVLTSDAEGNVTAHEIGAPGWIVVEPSGDTTGAKDWAAIQDALNGAASGQVVYLTAGVFYVYQPITVPPCITLRGTTRVFWWPAEGGTPNGVLAPQSKIMPSATFTGTAVVQVVDKDTGGYSAASGNQTISYITIDGSDLPAGNSVNGFQTIGSVMGLTMDNCSAGLMGGHGFITQAHTGSGEGYGYLDELDMSHCVFLSCGGDGVHLSGTADSTFTAIESIDHTGSAWHVEACNNSKFLGCKGEWSGTGWTVIYTTGDVATPRNSFIGCSTDYNTGDGFYIAGNQGGGVVTLTGCEFHGDGHGGSTTAAGLHISGAGFPVLVQGCGAYVETLQSGSGYGPAYGLRADANPDLVSVTNCYFQGETAGWSTDGTGTVLAGSGVSVVNGGSTSAPGASSLQSATFGAVLASSVAASLTGATARFVGGTASGAPTSGTFAAGDCVIDLTGKIWVCTTAGTPGTWTQVVGSSGGGVTIDTTATDIQPLGSQAAGNSGKAADAKHVHAMPTIDELGLPAGNVAWNGKKITGLANGSAATDAAAFGQIPVIDTTATDIQSAGTQAAGSTGRAADAGHVHPLGGTVPSSTTPITGVTTAQVALAGPTIPANGIVAGMTYEFDAWGTITTTADTQTITWGVYFGGVAGTALLTFSNLNPNSSATLTNSPFRLRGKVQFLTTTQASSTADLDVNFFPSSANQGTATVSGSTAKQLVVGVTPSATGVSITVNGGIWRRIN